MICLYSDFGGNCLDGNEKMTMKMDKETQRAWDGWVVFTRFATGSVVAIAVLLGLMALFLT